MVDPAVVSAIASAVRSLRAELGEQGSIVIVLPAPGCAGFPACASSIKGEHLARILRQIADCVDDGAINQLEEPGKPS